MIEYVFPGTVVIMKLAFRNAVAREFDVLDFGKSLLAFPVDISFLGLSFSAISLSHVQDSMQKSLDIRVSYTAFIGCIVLLVIQHAISRASEAKLDKAEYALMGGLAFVAYLLSGAVLICTLILGGVLQ